MTDRNNIWRSLAAFIGDLIGVLALFTILGGWLIIAAIQAPQGVLIP